MKYLSSLCVWHLVHPLFVQQMEMLEADILSGKFKPFGDLDDAALGGMMEYVDGIDATVPK